MVLRNRRAAAVATLVGVSLFALLAVRPGTPMSQVLGQAADPAGSADADAAIRGQNKAYVAALVSGDLEAVLAFWAPDSDYVDEAGKITRGKNDIAALFKSMLPDLKGARIDGTIQNLRFLRPDICLEDGTIEVTSPTGTRDSSRFAAVWTRIEGKWLLSSVRDLPGEVTELPTMAAAQLKDLEWLVGEWATADAKGGVTLSCRWDTNKSFLLMDYAVKAEGEDPLKVTVRVGWDGASGRIRSWVFDSQGGFGEGFWTKEGKSWVVGSAGVLPDGGIGESTNEYEFVDADTFVWRATEREIDGQPLADVDAKFVRQPAAK